MCSHCPPDSFQLQEPVSLLPYCCDPPAPSSFPLLPPLGGAPPELTQQAACPPLDPGFYCYFFYALLLRFVSRAFPPSANPSAYFHPTTRFFFFFFFVNFSFFFSCVARLSLSAPSSPPVQGGNACNEMKTWCSARIFFFFFLFSSEEEDHMLCRIFGLGEPSTTPTSPGDTQTHKKPASVFVVP